MTRNIFFSFLAALAITPSLAQNNLTINEPKIIDKEKEFIRKRLCQAVTIFKPVQYTDELTSKTFDLYNFESVIYHIGLSLNENNFKNLSDESLKIQFEKFEKYWTENDVWKMKCTEADDIIFFNREMGLIESVAMFKNFQLFFRLFFSGAYDLDIVNEKINEKNQTLFEWIEETISSNPKNLYPTYIEYLKKIRLFMMDQHPELKEKSKLSITDN